MSLLRQLEPGRRGKSLSASCPAMCTLQARHFCPQARRCCLQQNCKTFLSSGTYSCKTFLSSGLAQHFCLGRETSNCRLVSRLAQSCRRIPRLAQSCRRTAQSSGSTSGCGPGHVALKCASRALSRSAEAWPGGVLAARRLVVQLRIRKRPHVSEHRPERRCEPRLPDGHRSELQCV